jgi:hypothetical protein
MVALSKAGAARFRARALAFLSEHLPDRCNDVEPASLSAVIEGGIARAESYGFCTEQHLVKYLVLLLSAGPHFDLEPAAAAVLSSAETAEIKMERLVAAVIPHAEVSKA